jgi:hypothetical protein
LNQKRLGTPVLNVKKAMHQKVTSIHGARLKVPEQEEDSNAYALPKYHRHIKNPSLNTILSQN